MRDCDTCGTSVARGLYTLTAPTRFYCDSDCVRGGRPGWAPLTATSEWVVSWAERLLADPKQSRVDRAMAARVVAFMDRDMSEGVPA